VAKAPKPPGEEAVTLRLAKPVGFTDDARHVVDRTIYYNHCQNLATVIAAATTEDRQAAITAYLTASNAETVEGP
jgi:hypothetical protein